MQKFEDWFEEIEVTSPRCFRFWEELQDYINDAKEYKSCSAAPIEKWLRAAYLAGRDHMQDAAVETATNFKTKMDAGKEHIVVALENLR